MRVIKIGLLTLMLGLQVAWAQVGSQVIVSQGPKATIFQKLFFYTGANLTYVCTALSASTVESTVTVTAATRANPGVFTSVGHGFDLSTRPKVSFRTNPTDWSGLIGAWILVPIDADTFKLKSIVTGTDLNTSAYASAWSGSYPMYTTAPRTTLPIWQVEWYQYDGSSNLTSSLTAFAPTSTQVKCSDRASTYLEWR